MSRVLEIDHGYNPSPKEARIFPLHPVGCLTPGGGNIMLGFEGPGALKMLMQSQVLSRITTSISGSMVGSTYLRWDLPKTSGLEPPKVFNK